MHHPDVEYPILLSMAEERIRGKGPVKGLRRASSVGQWRLRIMESSGNSLISLGKWLKARGDQPVLATPGTMSKVGT